MGIKLNAQAKENLQYLNDTKVMTRIMVNRFFSPLKRLDPIYKLTKEYREERQITARILSFTKKVIEDRRKLRKVAFSNDINRDKKMLSLISILLEAERDGKPLTDEDIMYETQTFLLAVNIIG